MIDRMRLVRTCVVTLAIIIAGGLVAQEANQNTINGQPTQEQPQPQETPPQAPEQPEVPTPSQESPSTQISEMPASAILPAEPVSEIPSAAQQSEVPMPSPAPEQSMQVAPSESVPSTEVAVPQEIQSEPPAEPQPQLGLDEIMGIDTVDLESPQGNWLYKRVWWEKAEKQYEKIRNAVNKILELRTGFFAKRAELDKTVLDPFYIKIGLSQGELQEILSELIARLTKETKTRDSEAAEDAIEQAESDKQELQQLQKEVEQVVKQDAEVEDAIIMLVEQINKIRRLEQDAWQNFKNIARVLDDKKARELFYKVDNAWRNVQELHSYIEQTYSNSFDQLIERIKEKIKKIDSTILALKEKGVDLKQRILSRIEADQEEEEEAPKKGIFTRYLVDPIKSVFSAIWSVIRWPIDKIMGRTAVQQEEEEEPAEPEPQEQAEQPVATQPRASQAESPISQVAQPVVEDVIEEETIVMPEEPSDTATSDTDQPSLPDKVVTQEATVDSVDSDMESDMAEMRQPEPVTEENEMEPAPAVEELQTTIQEE